MSVREVAKEMGITANSYYVVESGKVYAWPKFRRDVAKVLGVPEHLLFEGSDLKEFNLKQVS